MNSSPYDLLLFLSIWSFMATSAPAERLGSLLKFLTARRELSRMIKGLISLHAWINIGVLRGENSVQQILRSSAVCFSTRPDQREQQTALFRPWAAPLLLIRPGGRCLIASVECFFFILFFWVQLLCRMPHPAHVLFVQKQNSSKLFASCCSRTWLKLMKCWGSGNRFKIKWF